MKTETRTEISTEITEGDFFLELTLRIAKNALECQDLKAIRPLSCFEIFISLLKLINFTSRNVALCSWTTLFVATSALILIFCEINKLLNFIVFCIDDVCCIGVENFNDFGIF